MKGYVMMNIYNTGRLSGRRYCRRPVCCIRYCWQPQPVSPPVPTGSFTAVKQDRSTGAVMAGAEYTLYQSGQAVKTAVSGTDGRLTFSGLSPGTYELIEMNTPDGFRPEQTSYRVTADENGNVTIDGQPADGHILFNVPEAPVSSPPVLYDVRESDMVVAGTGVPGSTITVRFPSGVTSMSTVNSDGTWIAMVPSDVTLQAGEWISATQTEIGRTESQEVTVIVQANTLQTGDGDTAAGAQADGGGADGVKTDGSRKGTIPVVLSELL